MSLEKLKEKAKAVEAKNPKAAIAAWEEAIAYQEENGEPNPDITMYNKVGDLHLKAGDPAKAADAFERAVDKYAELGFHNNAIAMCNKVLRNAPGRAHIYVKLAKLFAAKGFLAEAKQHFLDYAERMQKAGRVSQAVSALKEFTDISPEADELRDMLSEHLKAYGAGDKRRSSAAVRAPVEPAKPKEKEKEGGPRRKTSSLVFLDLDAPSPKKKGAEPAKAAPAAPPPKAAAPPATPPPPLEEEAEESEGLVIQGSSLVDEPAAPESVGMLEGLETTSMDFGGPGETSEVVLDEAVEEETEESIELVEEAPPRPSVPPAKRPAVGPPPKPAAAPPTPPTPVKRPSLVELPPLELEPDFAVTNEGAGTPTVDDGPLTIDDASSPAGMDIGAGDIVRQTDQAASIFADLVAAEAPLAAAGNTIEELEAQVAENPDDPQLHRRLGEALIEAGKRERGIEELDIACGGFEAAGDFVTGEALLEEALRLDPNSVRHRQKAVEYAFKSGEKPRLIDAYLELADALLRGDNVEKATAVYHRVVEHDPGNKRAQSALSMLTPAAPASGDEPKKAKAKDAKMKVRADADEAGDFVDLGALIMEQEEEPARDTRMKVQDEEPTGDEEKDFHDMLAKFKQGIDENIEETDFQSHYDLGVAFKEMGLVDEAIAEFQKALRAPEGRLRTSEALGICFFDKGQFSVAETIFRRALELEAKDDKERLGILYWLGRCLEEDGKAAEAKTLYQRVFAVDIRFQDVSERVKHLAKAR